MTFYAADANSNTDCMEISLRTHHFSISHKSLLRIGKTLTLIIAGILASGLSLAQFPAGTYTVNSSLPTSTSNFNSFTDFTTALSIAGNAISGNVVLNVVQGSGPYTEQLVLPHIQGTGPGSGTTRIGIVVNGSGETIRHGGSAMNHAVILLDGMDYFTANNLVVVNTDTNLAFGVRIGDNSDHNRFDNCTFNNTASDTYYQSTCILTSDEDNYADMSSNAGEFVEIWNSTMLGGYYGIRFNGGDSINSIWPQGYDVTGCDFQDQYYYGIYTYRVYDVDFVGNTMDFANTNNSFGYCTFFYYTNNLYIEGNSITNSKPYGFRVYYSNHYNTTVINGRSKFVNNMHHGGFVYSSYGYPMYFYQAHDFDIVYNSFQTWGKNLVSSANGFFAGYCDSIRIENNAVQSESSSSTNNYMCVVGLGSGILSFDYNTFFTTSQQPGNEIYSYDTIIYTGLAAFQAATGTNTHSQFADPGYVSTTDNHVNQGSLFQKGIAYSGTLIDFDGTARPSIKPSHGAHEFPYVPTGIADREEDNNVILYPNPVSDVLTIDASSVQGDVLNIEISNVSGQVFLTHQIKNFSGNAIEQIYVTGLSKGVFFVKIYNEDVTVTRRFVVQR